MPTKTLPPAPNLDHLKNQAKDLLKLRQSGDPSAFQRIREFHPRFRGLSDAEIGASEFSVTDAQLAIAREYGYASWARLKSHIAKPGEPKRDMPLRDRIEDKEFRHALDLLDAGDESGLRRQLETHPALVRERVTFEGQNYFRNPALLEFCAENPIRNGKLPANIVAIARLILDAGGRNDQSSIDSTLGLVCSGKVTRECGVQVPLIDLLCNYGADPTTAMGAALGHGEFEAVNALLRRGAALDLAAASALGRVEDAMCLLQSATEDGKQLALAYAAQYGHLEIVQLLLDAGVDPNRFNPVGAHSHSTPLHQAAFAGHLSVVQLLVERGSSLETKDILWKGTPRDWAQHGGKTEVVEYMAKAENATCHLAP